MQAYLFFSVNNYIRKRAEPKILQKKQSPLTKGQQSPNTNTGPQAQTRNPRSNQGCYRRIHHSAEFLTHRKPLPESDRSTPSLPQTSSNRRDLIADARSHPPRFIAHTERKTSREPNSFTIEESHYSFDYKAITHTSIFSYAPQETVGELQSAKVEVSSKPNK